MVMNMSKLKKTGLTIFIVVVVLAALITYFYVKISDELDLLIQLPIVDVDLSTVEDGTYTGEYEQFPVSVILEVEVVNHEIVSIEIIQHDNGKGAPAEAIILDVIEQQSIDVDTIAGATYSSKVILLAIKDALS